MKRILIAFALAAASFSTTACNLPGGIESIQPANTALDEKALYAAEAIYNVPAFAYVTADSRDQMSPALKAQIKPKMQKLGEILDKTREAYRLGNALTFNASKKDLQTLAAEISAMIP